MWDLAKDKYRGITANRVRELFDYKPETGQLIWKKYRPLQKKKTGGRPISEGDTAGYISTSDGYRYIGFDHQEILAHRLIWLWMTGQFPKCQIDHINKIRNDNRWVNLREATNSQNTHRADTGRPNTSTGIKGIWFDKSRNQYRVRLRCNGADVAIGRFLTLDEAIKQKEAAELKYFGEFAR